MTIARTKATTFLHQLQIGSTGPAVFRCLTEAGDGKEYVVKFRGRLGQRIISEYMVAALGKRLGLPMPSAAIVEIDQRIADLVTNTEVSAAIVADPGPHIGTMFLTGGYSIFGVETYLPPALSPTIASIFAFDMMTQNYDRVVPNHGSPNLLVRGDDLFIIDHDKAFGFAYPHAPFAAPVRPWALRNLSWIKHHVFYRRLKQQAENGDLSFDDFMTRLEMVTEEFLDAAIADMPHPWYDERIISTIRAHLIEILENSDAFRTGLLEVFA